ncbi:MAG: hypothetical protein M9933_02335 [Chitinophagaceae bacterium]|nr:hypothetical protein [Chitinophagaceae bacterium]
MRKRRNSPDSLEDIAAFKLNVICHRKEKKDYIAIAALLNKRNMENRSKGGKSF